VIHCNTTSRNLTRANKHRIYTHYGWNFFVIFVAVTPVYNVYLATSMRDAVFFSVSSVGWWHRPNEYNTKIISYVSEISNRTHWYIITTFLLTNTRKIIIRRKRIHMSLIVSKHITVLPSNTTKFSAYQLIWVRLWNKLICIHKTRSNPFLEPTGTLTNEDKGSSSMEPKGAYGAILTHADRHPQIINQTRLQLHHVYSRAHCVCVC